MAIRKASLPLSKKDRNPATPRARHTGTPWGAFNKEETVRRWLEQAERDSTGGTLRRLLASEDVPMGALFWEMHDLGLKWRRVAAQALYEQYGGGYRMPDVRGDIGFSRHALVKQLASLHAVIGVAADERTRLMVEKEQRQRATPILAWMDINPNERAPVLILEMAADTDAWLFEAVCVLGQYIKDRPHYQHTPLGGRIVLNEMRDDTLLMPLLHQFAKGFLWLPQTCPPSWGCHCNMTYALLNQRCERHPHATGELTPVPMHSLSSGPAISHPRHQRPTTPILNADTLPRDWWVKGPVRDEGPEWLGSALDSASDDEEDR